MVNKAKKDLAKHTVLVLLILTIMLSSISTWIVLDALNQIKEGYIASKDSKPVFGNTEANIRLGILNTQAAPNTNTVGSADVKVDIVK
ncbi:MAG: hypothetical protein V1660_01175 [archaeon]